jgi:hypothetical protein
MFKSENFLLTFRKTPKKISPPQVEGDEGEGGIRFLLSTLALPRQRGRDKVREISNIFG